MLKTAMRATMLRQILLRPPTLRTSVTPLYQRTLPVLSRRYSALPSIIQKDFWLGMIPKPLRKSSPSAVLKKKFKSKEWNPATFFIIIFLLIGSMSIQMIALRNEFSAFSRRADARIGLLKEIIERIQKGEEVDVEGLLGTGDAVREKEWEEVLQEIERDDQAWKQSRKSKPDHGQNPEGTNSQAKPQVASQADPVAKPKSNAPPGFY
ncbi:hypothetical protein QTJ16_001028 [Diplocarpon rosae]|uniref:Uncharacterized protein n=1 Tax=Diplocarpon rosae TaxID=946125 RepID=A0AAD9T778_9HELO|nr:hypothetical protein QTJ16_001028 [Diplocarpon rosae]